ncbi:hypothetical protein GCM10022233_71740 [Streptomyces shaanxiensis]|uniref:Transposase n=1 Tax=Streptomyces shaanxiensis TaxID=653357 RepID=A0ABP7W4L0_9ACTN
MTEDVKRRGPRLLTEQWRVLVLHEERSESRAAPDGPRERGTAMPRGTAMTKGIGRHGPRLLTQQRRVLVRHEERWQIPQQRAAFADGEQP